MRLKQLIISTDKFLKWRNIIREYYFISWLLLIDITNESGRH